MTGYTLEQRLQKRTQTQALMREMGISTWVVWVEDNKAEHSHLPLIGAPYGSARKAYVLTPDRAVSICPDIEAQIQRDYGFEVIHFEDRNVLSRFRAHFKEIAGPRAVPIALNFSDTFGALDTLGLGNYRKITEVISRQYFFSVPEEAFVSADQLIMASASSKLPFEIEFLRQAAQLTYDVLEEGFKQFRAGMTEKQAAGVLRAIAKDRMSHDSSIGYSWPEEHNPIVLTREGIAGSPHAPPSDRIIEPGSTIYVDFGLSVHGYTGDIQHFGYVLRDGETSAPDYVKVMYDLLVQSIQAGMQVAKPGALGWQVDEASRSVITRAGHPSYKHATGHQLGSGNTHAPGAAFAIRYANDGSLVPESHLPLRQGFVMTIEPRIQIANGASIEVDGVITDAGFELLAPLQEEIYLVK